MVVNTKTRFVVGKSYFVKLKQGYAPLIINAISVEEGDPLFHAAALHERDRDMVWDRVEIEKL